MAGVKYKLIPSFIVGFLFCGFIINKANYIITDYETSDETSFTVITNPLLSGKISKFIYVGTK